MKGIKRDLENRKLSQFFLLQSPYLSAYPANPPAYYPQSGNLPSGNVSVSF
jgi:hypothetical protein